MISDFDKKLRKAMQFYKLHPDEYAKRHVKILDKDKGSLIYFLLNEPQKLLLEYIRDKQRERVPIKIILLKARQIGFTTFIAMLNLLASMYGNFVWSLIINSTKEYTQATLKKYKMMHRYITGFPVPKTSTDSKNEFEFRDTDSGITILSANDEMGGRGNVYTRSHCTEVAFWAKAHTAMKALEQCFSDTNPNVFMVDESTANGRGGYFYDEWQAGVAGEIDKSPWFFSWFQHPRYRIPLHKAPPGIIIRPEILDMGATYGLSREQMIWREWVVSAKCQNDFEFSRQEYPCCPEEAFLYTGRTVFDKEKLYEISVRVDKIEPVWVGEVTNNDDLIEGLSDELKIWKQPDPVMHYVIGADVAEGLEKNEDFDGGDGAKDGDFSVADIICTETCEQVAQLRGRMDADIFAKKLAYIGRRYNMACIAPEVNDHGRTVVFVLNNVLSYPNLYRPEKNFGILQRGRNEYGWETNGISKSFLIDNTRRFVRERLVVINSKQTVHELGCFRKNRQGNMKAMHGENDDCVMALGIALECYRLQPEDWKMAEVQTSFVDTKDMQTSYLEEDWNRD